MKTISRFVRSLFILSLLTLVARTNEVRGDDAEIRRQSEELATLLSHYGAMPGVMDRLFYMQDDAKYRETAKRLSEQAASPELKDIAGDCLQILSKIDRGHVAYDELTKDRPGPGKTFHQMMLWVAEQSRKGAFVWKSTSSRQEHGWTITEKGMKDHTVSAALFYGTVGMAMNQEAERKHQIGVFKLRQAAAKELIKLGDEIEQLRVKSAQKLVERGFLPFAGPLQPEPRLEMKLGREEFDRSIIDRFIEQKQKEALAAEREKERLERQKRGEPDRNEPLPVRANLSLRNPGPPLRRVWMTIDYFHYRLPNEAVARQSFWLPEWQTNEVFSITEAMRLNLSNRAMAGLNEDVHGSKNLFGNNVFPQFLGLTKLKYSLWSDTLRQGNVVVEFPENRDLIRDTMLENAENLSLKLIQATSSRGDWSTLPAPEKAERTRIATSTVKDFATMALALAPEGWSEASRAIALTKDYKSITKQVESTRNQILKACQPGMVYGGKRDGDLARLRFSSGSYELEFTNAKSPQKIEVTITRTAGPEFDPPVQRYLGKLVPHPEQPSRQMLSLTLVKEPAAAENKTAAAKKGTVPKGTPKSNTPATDPFAPPPGASGNLRPPGMEPMPWELAWKKDHWECIHDQTEFVFVTRKEVAEVGRPTKNPVPTAAEGKAPPGFATNSTWEGTRVITDDAGRVLARQKLKFVVRDVPGLVQFADPNQFVCIADFYVDDKKIGDDTQVRVGSRFSPNQVSMVVATRPANPRAPGMSIDQFEGEIKRESSAARCATIAVPLPTNRPNMLHGK